MRPVRSPGRSSRRRMLALLAGILAGVFLMRELLRRRDVLPYRRLWQSALTESFGKPAAGVIMGSAGAEYRRLISHQLCPRHPVLAYHLRWQILPALALYRALRRHGVEQSRALQEVERLAWREIGPLYQRAVGRLKVTADPFP
ncbi:MAG: hypothetical protein ACP5TV_11525, partial [Anaerolineae bacterium]